MFHFFPYILAEKGSYSKSKVAKGFASDVFLEFVLALFLKFSQKQINDQDVNKSSRVSQFCKEK